MKIQKKQKDNDMMKSMCESEAVCVMSLVAACVAAICMLPLIFIDAYSKKPILNRTRYIPNRTRYIPWGLILRKGFNQFALMMLFSAAVGSAHWAIFQRDKVSYPDAVKRAYDMRGLAKPERAYPIMGLLSLMAAAGVGAFTISNKRETALYIRSLYENKLLGKMIFPKKFDGTSRVDGDDYEKEKELIDKFSLFGASEGFVCGPHITSNSAIESDIGLAMIDRLYSYDWFDMAVDSVPYINPKAQNLVLVKGLLWKPGDIDKLVQKRPVHAIPTWLMDKYYRGGK